MSLEVERQTHDKIAQSYSTSKMSQRWKAILNDMEDYGLIYKRPVRISDVPHRMLCRFDVLFRTDHQRQET
jgi:hypothetical protein